MYKFIDLDTGLPAALNKIKTWVNSKLTSKQDAINDLDTIRSGAAAGATAYQKPSGGIPASDIASGVIPDTSGFATTSAMNTALDAKANAADVPTKTEMADAIDDALGEAQVTVVPQGSVGVISSLGSDSDSDALSASMGKKLKVAMLTILNSLGNYAFLEGKPVIDWGDDTPVTYTVSKTIGTGLSAAGGDTDVELGDSLEVSVAITDNLYIIDDDNIEVIMGGSPVAGAWDASTQKVTIAAVTGNVVINVPSLTYVSSGLVVMFDGKNQGSTASQWENLANANKPLVLSGGYTKGTDHVEFDGTDGFGLIDGYNEALPFESTSVESVLSFDSLPNVVKKAMLVMANCKNQSIALQFTSSGNVMGATQAEGATAPIAAMGTLANAFAANEKVRVVEYGNDFMLNNTAVDKSGTDKFIIVPNNTSTYSQGYGDLCVSGYYTRAGAYMYPFDGKIFAIRIYSKKLSVDELTQNWKVDKKRFNIS